MIAQPATDRSILLRRALLANCAFSEASGVLFVLGAQPIATFLGLNAPLVLIVIGVGLLLYGVALYQTATRPHINPMMAQTAVVMDTLWVIGSVILLMTGWVPFTPAGGWAVAVVAVIVADFAMVQFYGLRRMQNA